MNFVLQTAFVVCTTHFPFNFSITCRNLTLYSMKFSKYWKTAPWTPGDFSYQCNFINLINIELRNRLEIWQESETHATLPIHFQRPQRLRRFYLKKIITPSFIQSIGIHLYPIIWSNKWKALRSSYVHFRTSKTSFHQNSSIRKILFIVQLYTVHHSHQTIRSIGF